MPSIKKFISNCWILPLSWISIPSSYFQNQSSIQGKWIGILCRACFASFKSMHVLHHFPRLPNSLLVLLSDLHWRATDLPLRRTSDDERSGLPSFDGWRYSPPNVSLSLFDVVVNPLSSWCSVPFTTMVSDSRWSSRRSTLHLPIAACWDFFFCISNFKFWMVRDFGGLIDGLVKENLKFKFEIWISVLLVWGFIFFLYSFSSKINFDGYCTDVY